MNAILRCTVALLGAALANAQPPAMGGNAIILAQAGYQVPSPSLDVAPGQVIVLHVHGITARIDSNLAPVLGPSGFPHVLNGISVDLIQGKAATVTSLELRAAYQTHCEDPCSPVPASPSRFPSNSRRTPASMAIRTRRCESVRTASLWAECCCGRCPTTCT
ncbi:MAG: hypothetical protein LAQ69_14745 [Acidobacteriia bacterium]|nr:hypothetical protein [Terriglobia bacterium]